MRQIYIVRHGKTDYNIQKKIMGHLDPSLNITFKDDIEKVGGFLKNIKFDMIFTSNLKRAHETAKIINQHLEAPTRIIVSDGLKEIDYGQLSGMLKSKAKKEHPRYHKDVDYLHPDGESFNELYQRIVFFIKKVINKGIEGNILIVTHAGCIRALYSYFNNEDFQKNINLKLGHRGIVQCSISEGLNKCQIIQA